MSPSKSYDPTPQLILLLDKKLALREGQEAPGEGHQHSGSP